MIRSWRNAASRRVWNGETPNQLRGLDFTAAVDLLSALNVAETLQDLSPLKSVGLHKLMLAGPNLGVEGFEQRS